MILLDLSFAGDLDPMTLKPFPPPVSQIAPQLAPRAPSLEANGSQSFSKLWRLQRRSSEGRLSGQLHWLRLLSVTLHAVVVYVTDRQCRKEA